MSKGPTSAHLAVGPGIKSFARRNRFDGIAAADKGLAAAEKALHEAKDSGDGEMIAEAKNSLETAKAQKAKQDDIKAKHPRQWKLRIDLDNAERDVFLAKEQLSSAQSDLKQAA